MGYKVAETPKKETTKEPYYAYSFSCLQVLSGIMVYLQLYTKNLFKSRFAASNYNFSISNTF